MTEEDPTGSAAARCSLCGREVPDALLREAGWADPAVVEALTRRNPWWRRADGACPACVQQVLLELLLRRGDPALHHAIQQVWPLDADSVYGALPTPLRLHADPHYTGRGVTLALVDSGFFPHPDLVEPVNRIVAWVDATRNPPTLRRFSGRDRPTWPGWDARAAWQWHGLMTSTVAAGNGHLSAGLYRGLASEAHVVLVQVRDPENGIRPDSVAAALEWLGVNRDDLCVRVVSLSVAAGSLEAEVPSPVDRAVAALVAKGVVVVTAAGNDGERRLLPPATAPEAVTVGGLDDRNTFDHAEVALWHSNYAAATDGTSKPELVAPSMWVIAPLLPNSDTARQAFDLFERRRAGDEAVERAIAEQGLVRPEYKLVEGTSFAAPIVASIACCMLEAHPGLNAPRVKALLQAASTPVAGAAADRQGSGAIDAGRAVALALREPGGGMEGIPAGPELGPGGVRFRLARIGLRSVEIFGSWNGWRAPHPATMVRPGFWEVLVPGIEPGQHGYKFCANQDHWLEDPANPVRESDGFGGFNSILRVRGERVAPRTAGGW